MRSPNATRSPQESTRSAPSRRSRRRRGRSCGSTSNELEPRHSSPPAGGLVFGGDGNGRFRAFDQETGAILWEINLGSSVTGFPITYAVDGTQYVAVSTGTSLSSQDNLRLTAELRPSTGNNLFVFALP